MTQSTIKTSQSTQVKEWEIALILHEFTLKETTTVYAQYSATSLISICRVNRVSFKNDFSHHWYVAYGYDIFLDFFLIYLILRRLFGYFKIVSKKFRSNQYFFFQLGIRITIYHNSDLNMMFLITLNLKNIRAKNYHNMTYAVHAQLSVIWSLQTLLKLEN